MKAVQEDAVDEHTGDSSLVIADDSDVEDETPAPAQVKVVEAPAQAPAQAPAAVEVLAPVPAQATAAAQAPAAPKVLKKVVRTAKKE